MFRLHNNHQSGKWNVVAETMEYDEEVRYNSISTESFHVDTDITEILANTTTTQTMARTSSIGGNTFFISQENEP
jgi:hypothetical protein